VWWVSIAWLWLHLDNQRSAQARIPELRERKGQFGISFPAIGDRHGASHLKVVLAERPCIDQYDVSIWRCCNLHGYQKLVHLYMFNRLHKRWKVQETDPEMRGGQCTYMKRANWVLEKLKHADLTKGNWSLQKQNKSWQPLFQHFMIYVIVRQNCFTVAWSNLIWDHNEVCRTFDDKLDVIRNIDVNGIQLDLS